MIELALSAIITNSTMNPIEMNNYFAQKETSYAMDCAMDKFANSIDKSGLTYGLLKVTTLTMGALADNLVVKPLNFLYTVKVTNSVNTTMNYFTLCQNIGLIAYDIYPCTKIGMTQWGQGEANPLAAYFFNQGMFDVGFVLATLATTLAMPTLDSIDNSGMLSKLAVAIVAIAEIKAISTWTANQKDQGNNINVKAMVFSYNF
jgi:hypothetical protein